jgi:Fe-S cluster assembly protein SufD
VSVVADVRQEAAERFAQLGWPTTRLEEWKYTSLAAVARVPWRMAAGSESEARPGGTQPLATIEYHFVNGSQVAKHGTAPGVSDIDTTGDLDFTANAMVALNAAHVQDGARLAIAENAIVGGFVHLLFTGSGDGIWSHPRNVIHVGRNAQVTIVETYVGSGNYFTNAVTEIVAEEGAVVDHYKIVRESDEAFHVGTVHIRQHRSSNVTQRNIAVGGKLVRNDIHTLLAGEGSSVVLDGLFVGTGSQHIDNHTTIDHLAPHCESLELYKGILDQSARGIFDGTIIVREGAQKTISRQTNHNLLLSESAIVDSKPTLVIHNDDVKCNHGSTIGQLNEEALFYLRARGIGEEAARGLLIYAFASELADRMKVEPVREQIRAALFQQMPDRLPERRENPR